jgi:hypothetical protein
VFQKYLSLAGIRYNMDSDQNSVLRTCHWLSQQTRLLAVGFVRLGFVSLTLSEVVLRF